MANAQKILFSIDLEEFDIPEEYGCTLELNRKLEVSYEGMKRLEVLLDSLQITSTIFTTAFSATYYPDFVKQLSSKHEIASHTYYHNVFQLKDLLDSRERLANIIGKPVTGLRMPRMQ